MAGHVKKSYLDFMGARKENIFHLGIRWKSPDKEQLQPYWWN